MICLSGGMDSTYALWRVATETDDELHAHYVRVQNPKWADAEVNAVTKITEWISHRLRPVTATISSASYAGPPSWLRTPNIAIHHASIQAIFAGFGANDRIIVGRNASDDETDLHEPLHLSASGRAKYDHGVARQTVIDLTFESATERPSYERLEPFPTREQMIDDLPETLLRMFSSCNDPRVVDGIWMPCGRQTPGQSPMNAGECRKCHILGPLLPRFSEAKGWVARGLG